MAAVAGDQRDMAVAGDHVELRRFDVGGEPRGVLVGDHQIKIALPNAGGDGDAGEVKAPRPDEGEVIIDPAIEAAGESAAHFGGHGIGVGAGEFGLIDWGDQPAEGGGEFGAGDGAETLHVGFLPGAQRRFALQARVELLDIFGSHAGEEIEIRFAIGADTGEDGRTLAAIGEQGGASEGVRAAAGPAGGMECCMAEMIQQVSGELGDVGDAAAFHARGGRVAGAAHADQAEMAGSAIIVPIREGGGVRWGAVMHDQGVTVRIAAEK